MNREELEILSVFRLKGIATECGIAFPDSIDKPELLRLLTDRHNSDPGTTIDRGYEPRKPLFMSGNAILSEAVQVRKLIGKIIERGCTGQLFGPSGDGKTFIVLDIGLCVATGRQWNGHQCERGLVLYFNGEGRSGAKRRFKAWCKHNNISDISSFHVSTSTITFDDAGLNQVTAEVKELEAVTGQAVALIMIDTLARHLIGDENSTKDMSEFVRTVDGLRDSFPESTVLLVHHTGVDAERTGRSRGSSALKAACDFEIQCMGGVITFTKMKDAAAPEPIEFKLMPVDIGTDEDGEQVESCIVVYGERSAKNRQAKEVKLSATEKHVLKMIAESVPSGLIEDARNEYCRRMQTHCPDLKPDTPRRNFERALKGLLEKEQIFIDGLFIRVGQPDKFRTSPDNIDASSGRTRTALLRGCPTVRDVSVEAEPEFFSDDEFDFSEGLPL